MLIYGFNTKLGELSAELALFMKHVSRGREFSEPMTNFSILCLCDRSGGHYINNFLIISLWHVGLVVWRETVVFAELSEKAKCLGSKEGDMRWIMATSSFNPVPGSPGYAAAAVLSPMASRGFLTARVKIRLEKFAPVWGV